MKTEYTSEHYFAALKLIEQLHKDSEISAHMFRNILRNHANVVDISKFTILEEKEDVT
jgi:hypothetical protein